MARNNKVAKRELTDDVGAAELRKCRLRLRFDPTIRLMSAGSTEPKEEA